MSNSHCRKRCTNNSPYSDTFNPNWKNYHNFGWENYEGSQEVYPCSSFEPHHYSYVLPPKSKLEDVIDKYFESTNEILEDRRAYQHEKKYVIERKEDIMNDNDEEEYSSQPQPNLRHQDQWDYDFDYNNMVLIFRSGIEGDSSREENNKNVVEEEEERKWM